jgi:hypothetical protein
MPTKIQINIAQKQIKIGVSKSQYKVAKIIPMTDYLLWYHLTLYPAHFYITTQG